MLIREVPVTAGTFKPFDALQAIYGSRGIRDGGQLIAYCRIGEQSSHAWFVLKY